jgi:hypothetical protein
MRRREFITLLGGAAAAWPIAASAQQAAMPVIGFLHGASAEMLRNRVSEFQHGLQEAGFFEGQNLAIEYRWAESQYERLPRLAADLVRRQVGCLQALFQRHSRLSPRPRQFRSCSRSVEIRSRMVSSPASTGLAGTSPE